MEALRSLSKKLTTHKEKVIHALLLGSMVALGYRSAEQQKEIESLEAEKAALRASNTAASTAMWSWREELFRLAECDSPIISASRIRAIYGEEEPTPATSSPSIDATGNTKTEVKQEREGWKPPLEEIPLQLNLPALEERATRLPG